MQNNVISAGFRRHANGYAKWLHPGALRGVAISLLGCLLSMPFEAGATNHNLGTLGGTKSISGRITSSDVNGYDVGIHPYQHVYSFRAAASGTMRISSFSTSHPKGNGSVSLNAYATHTTEWYNAGSGTMPVTKGEEYAVRVYSYLALNQTFSFTLYVPGSSGGSGGGGGDDSGGGGGGGYVAITFNPNGGSITSGDSRIFLESGTYTLSGLNVPTCKLSGYVFDGWYTAPTGGARMTSLVPSVATTYYAHWSAECEEQTVYIRFYSGGGSGSMSTITRTVSDCKATSYTIPSCSFNKSGYAFAGWKVENACEAGASIRQPGYTIYDLCGNLTLTATWKANSVKHIMTLYRNNSGGDGAGARRTVTEGAYYTLPTISSLGWTRSGYTFKGWATYRGATTATYGDGERIYVGSSLYSLYAVWQSNVSKHVVTLYRNNSSGDGAGARRTVIDGEYYTLPTIASLGWTRSGYTFKGWATYRGATTATYGDGERIYVGSSLYSLYAVWQSNVSTHVMTLYRNNSSGDGAGARRTVHDNAYYNLPTIDSLGWTRSGYTFKGWATYRGATTATYGDGECIYVGSSLYSLYAVWESTATKYVVRLHRNYSAGDGATAGRTMVVGSYRALPSVFSLDWDRDGYTFEGWAYYPDATVSDVIYVDGESVSNLSYFSGDEVHLYAVWRPRATGAKTFDGIW